MNTHDSATSRREFLKFLAASPVLAGAGSPFLLSGQTIRQVDFGLAQTPLRALNVFDMEAVAQDKLPLAHWGYLRTGVEGETTLRANREAFSKYHLRPRRLVDVSNIDMSTTLFGQQYKTPIFLCPAGSQKAFHKDGEIAVAKAAKNYGFLQMLSTVTTSSIQAVNKARGEPVWYQLYPTSSRSVTKGLVERALKAGSPAIVVTVDQLTSRNRETLARYRRVDDRDCTECHSRRVPMKNKPMFDGLDVGSIESFHDNAMTWDFVGYLRDLTGPDIKIMIKGIVTRDDAALCLQHGVDGIVVSNHGGRGQESGWASLDGLPEVVEAVKGEIPVFVDGGFRRGTDIFKALALGATAVGVGRPYLWGLAAFGQDGVERVLEILQMELEMAMKATGVRTLDEIRRTNIDRA